MGTERTYLMNPINGHFLFAAESGFGCLLDVLEAIIARGADFNARDQSARTPVMFSLIRASHMLKRRRRAHARIIAALLRRSADAIGLENRGLSALNLSLRVSRRDNADFMSLIAWRDMKN